VPVDRTFRMETLLRSFFFWLLEPAELSNHLAVERDFYANTVTTLRAYAAAKDRGDWGSSRQTRAMRIAIEAAIRVNEALAEWADWVIESDVMNSETFGKGTPDQ